MRLVLRTAVLSDVGRVRLGNEDAAVAGPRLAAVADGMGGHEAGEVASKIAISVLRELEDTGSETDILDALATTIDRVNLELQRSIAAGEGVQGMGTTVTALMTDGTNLALAHVGDSRAYRMRGDELTQITHDQTFVQMLIDAGKLTPEDAKHHPKRSVILQSLTGDREVEPDISIEEAVVGDRWLVCSDGLSSVIDEADIRESLTIPDRAQAAKRLVDLALGQGAPDNVTVIVADVSQDDEAVEVPSIAGAAVLERKKHDTSPIVTRPSTRRMVAAKIRRPLLARIYVIPIATVLVLGLLVAGAGVYVRSQYYVGNSKGMVVLYRGVPSLSKVSVRTNVPVSELSDISSKAIDGKDISGHKKDVIFRLKQLLDEACNQQPNPVLAACDDADGALR